MVGDRDTANILGDKALRRGRIGGTGGERADRAGDKGRRQVDVQATSDNVGGVGSMESVDIRSESTHGPN